MVIIEKTATEQKNCLSSVYYLESARKGERFILDELVEKGGYRLLLPAYIGFSINEGSGIFDPVMESGIKYDFYEINRDISINIDNLRVKLKDICQRNEKPVLLLVHYFGYPDKRITDVVSLCRNNGALIIEDCAHALYTDLIDHKCGEYGDFVLYSIHKMLPYEKGGILKVNNAKFDFKDRCLGHTIKEYSSIFNYNLLLISHIRKRNARLWERLLSGSNCQCIELLRYGCEGITPQTYPVFIHDYDRTKLYFELNKAGFGAVSLYHTMIEPIAKAFDTSVWVSQHIINLPIHQDVTEENIEEMYEKILDLLH